MNRAPSPMPHAGRATGAFINQMLVYALVMICAGGGVGLGTVWLRQKISVAANSGKILENNIADLKRQVDAIEAEIEKEQRAETLKRRNDLWRLGLVPPQETQVERVVENPVTALARKKASSILTDRPNDSIMPPRDVRDPELGRPAKDTLLLSAR